MTVLLGYEEKVKQESKGWLCHCHIHLRWEKGRMIALMGAGIRPAHACPNPRLKESPALSLSPPSLFLSRTPSTTAVSVSVCVSFI